MHGVVPEAIVVATTIDRMELDVLPVLTESLGKLATITRIVVGAEDAPRFTMFGIHFPGDSTPRLVVVPSWLTVIPHYDGACVYPGCERSLMRLLFAPGEPGSKATHLGHRYYIESEVPAGAVSDAGENP